MDLLYSETKRVQPYLFEQVGEGGGGGGDGRYALDKLLLIERFLYTVVAGSEDEYKQITLEKVRLLRRTGDIDSLTEFYS